MATEGSKLVDAPVVFVAADAPEQALAPILGQVLPSLREGRFDRLILVKEPGPRDARALVFIFGEDRVSTLVENDLLEVISANEADGRTFRRCVVVASDADQMSEMELRRVLTSLGPDSRMIIVGNNVRGGTFDTVYGIVGALPDIELMHWH